jgi:hypothetical protein
MRSQDTLDATVPAKSFNTAYEVDTVQILNWSPYAIYLRVGDNQAAGPGSYHYIVPRMTGMTIPCKARNFAAALAVTPWPIYPNTLNQRADFFFTVDEVVPMLGQIGLSRNVDMGFDSAYRETGQKITAGFFDAGVLTVIPAGYGAVIENAWIRDQDNNCRLILEIVLSGQFHPIIDNPAGVAGVNYIDNSRHVLDSGDYIHSQFLGCIPGDHLVWGASGYFFKTL